MVLERLVSVGYAIRHPLGMFFVGGIVSVISLFVAFLVFPTSIGLFSTFLTTFAITPFMVNLITYEETQEEEMLKRRVQMNFLARHKKILKIYSAFFSGMILFLSVTFLLLPQPTVQQLFEDQLREIKLIRGSAIIPDNFQRILINNVGVLILAFVFSLLYGAGAIFILTWNATVLAAAIGLAAQSFGGLHTLPAAILVFLPHGSLEILAYFVGGIAGGLISVAISRRRSTMFKIMLIDGLKLLAVAVVFLVAAALVEVSLIALTQ